MTTSVDLLIAEAREWTKDVYPPNGAHLVDRLADALEDLSSAIPAMTGAEHKAADPRNREEATQPNG